jgi:uncharacterized protein
VFGVGVLLLGTPLLLSLGYPFFEVLSFLLPTSLFISITQVFELKEEINLKFTKTFIISALPFIPIGLFFANRIGSNIGIIVGIFLLLTLPKGGLISKVFNSTNSLGRYFGLSILGFIHGLTNLGGSILPAFINKTCTVKDEKLATTAISYSLFVIIQIPYLLFIHNDLFAKNYLKIGVCILIGIIGNRVIGKWLYQVIPNEKYNIYLKIFISIIAVYLIIKWFFI